MAARRPRPTGDRGAARGRVSAERRRRHRHFARRRRDLIEDAGVALAFSLLLIGATAGLGVLALLMMLLAAVIAGSTIAERVISRRRAATRARKGRIDLTERVSPAAAERAGPSAPRRPRRNPAGRQRF